ncbi:outer membrane protein assembly factor BamE [Candidatus Liberibacter sp.]|uniref:outer membrane protein assembly factor BamE n=1 Tax=Candidatus Liberibacter sp. TaxID=34022 RepID=UPI0015F4B54D|nr:outer membrane protein assembly factor BamE [Candidatus Liberibacter sp.]MBA5723529.1 outer membrane protein assembly factor BamE [Candidatus Liberibacter sp.]
MHLICQSFKFRDWSLCATKIIKAALLVSFTDLMSSCYHAPIISSGEHISKPSSFLHRSREYVIMSLGPPSTISTSTKTFYYISQKRIRLFDFLKPKIMNRDVVAIRFGNDNRVMDINHYSLKDGKVFNMLSTTTPAPINEERSLLQDFLPTMGEK